MPTLPNAHPLVKEWITLPQALCWIVDGIEPDLIGEPGSLPSSPKTDAARTNLYRYWVSGQLELHGQSGKDATISDNETPPYKKMECHNLENLKKINKNLIRRGGINRIDWAHGTFYREIKDRDDCDECFFFYFENLRVNWQELYNLTLESNPSGNTRSVVQAPSANKKRGRGGPKRRDWPVIAALAAIIWEREAKMRETDQGLCNRTARILEVRKNEADGANYNPCLPRESFIRSAVYAVEQAIKLYPIKEDVSLRKRKRSKHYPPDILSCASALAVITIERSRNRGTSITESEIINLVTHNISAIYNVKLDDYYGTPRENLEKLSIENARKAEEYYNEWHRRSPDTRT